MFPLVENIFPLLRKKSFSRQRSVFKLVGNILPPLGNQRVNVINYVSANGNTIVFAIESISASSSCEIFPPVENICYKNNMDILIGRSIFVTLKPASCS